MTCCPSCGHQWQETAWPSGVWEVALAVFGPSIQNEKGQVRRTLDKKIGHAIREWQKRYGDPLNPEQEKYASSILCHAIRQGEEDARGSVSPVYPFVYSKLDWLRNHDTVHEGFKRRMVTVDVSAILAGAA